MQLLIDTTNQGILIFELRSDKRIVARMQKQITKLSEAYLTELQRFLKKHGFTLGNLTSISVNPGPGGFSSTRTGVVAANSLAYALNIPVHEHPSGRIKKLVLPKYDKLPNITVSKRKA